MSLQEDGQISNFNAELAGYNSQMQNYMYELSQWKQDIGAQQQQNEQIASFIQGSGMIGTDVIGKIISSKPFAMFTAYLERHLSLSDIVPKEFVDIAKNKLKEVIKQSTGIDLDKPSNVAWKESFDKMGLSFDDLKKIGLELKDGKTDFLKQKLEDGFIKAVQSKGPEIVREALKTAGFDLGSGENNPYLEQLRQLDINFDDITAAARGDVRPVLEKVAPVLKQKVIDAVSEKLNLPSLPETQSSPFMDALKTLTPDDVEKALKGNLQPLKEKLGPVAQEYVKQKIRDNLNIDLPEGDGTSSFTLPNMSDIQKAINGDYDGILRSMGSQVEQYAKQKLQEKTGINLDEAKSKYNIGYDDLQNLASGNYSAVLKKYGPQVKEFIRNKIQTKYGFDIGASNPQSAISIDDLKQLSQGNFQPIVDKYGPQVKQYVADKVKEHLGIDLGNGESSLPIGFDDIQNIASGNYKPVLDKYLPKVKQYIQDKIKSRFGAEINVDNLPASINIQDLQELARGNYQPIVDKISGPLQDYAQSKIKQYTGLDINVANTEQLPTTSDLTNLAQGKWEPIVSKYGPQVKQQIAQHLQDKFGVDIAKYKTELDNLPISKQDLISISQGDYRPILSKLQTQAEARTGITEKGLRTSFETAKQQALTAKTQLEQKVAQTRQQVEGQVEQTRHQIESQVRQGISQASDQASIMRSQLDTTVQTAQAQYEDLQRPPTSRQIAYYDNPVYEGPSALDATASAASRGLSDMFSGFRATGAKMLGGISSSISNLGKSIIGSFRSGAAETAGTVGGMAAQIGVGIGAGNIQDETTRDAVTVAGSAGAGAAVSTTSALIGGESTMDALRSGLSGGAEAGLLVGASIGAGFIPDRTARVATQQAISGGVTSYQLSSNSLLQRALGGAETTGDTTATATDVAAEAGASAATDFTELGSALVTAEELAAPTDAVPVLGEGVQSVIAISALGASLYFGLKDLFDDSSSGPPIPKPDVGAASFQAGV